MFKCWSKGARSETGGNIVLKLYPFIAFQRRLSFNQNSKHSNPVFKETNAVVNISVFCLIAYSVSKELRIKSALNLEQYKWTQPKRFCRINNVLFNRSSWQEAIERRSFLHGVRIAIYFVPT